MNKHRSVVGQWGAYLSRRSFGEIMQFVVFIRKSGAELIKFLDLL